MSIEWNHTRRFLLTMVHLFASIWLIGYMEHNLISLSRVYKCYPLLCVWFLLFQWRTNSSFLSNSELEQLIFSDNSFSSSVIPSFLSSPNSLPLSLFSSLIFKNSNKEQGWFQLTYWQWYHWNMLNLKLRMWDIL